MTADAIHRRIRSEFPSVTNVLFLPDDGRDGVRVTALPGSDVTPVDISRIVSSTFDHRSYTIELRYKWPGRLKSAVSRVRHSCTDSREEP